MHRVGAVALAALVSLVGCSSHPPARLSPPIRLDPLDVGQYATNPCALLRPDRAARRHLVPPGTPAPDQDRAGCQWNAADAAQPTILASVLPDQGLEDVYRQRDHYTAFQPLEIANYPAVHLSTDPGGPSAAHRCTTRVGVADNASLSVTATYPPGAHGAMAADPCGDSDELATEIMGQLLAGSP